MSQRKAFLLRIDPELLDAVQRWADDDLRSVNAQIEFLLRRALRETGRMKPAADEQRTKDEERRTRTKNDEH